MSDYNNKWGEYFADLQRYASEFGNCYIPTDGVHAELGVWVKELRRAYHDGDLPADKVALLDQIGIDWDAVGPHWERWESKYFDLLRFKRENGHVNVSQLQPGLGPWLSSQRVMHRQGVLPETRRALLDDLGIEWSPAKKLHDRWMEQFRKVEAFRERHGHCNVPRRTMPDPGIWVSAQRTAYRKGTLSKERVDLLQSIGFEWVAPGGQAKTLEETSD